MSLETGTRLGPYEISSPIASGGMGDVYRARDRRLGRDVAVIVLPAAMAGDPDRQARFEREARVVASLSHPHICAIYDVGRQAAGDAAIDFLVMELLDGETLAERLARGRSRSAAGTGAAAATPRPRRGSTSGSASGSEGMSAPAAHGRALPLDETLRVARQLAEALAAAHRAGIVHRDLKPSNVMLTKTGVKVLDFGLAKLHEPSPAASVEYATATAPLTDVGVVMGTMPYMAPEQVQGHDVDARADLFAFGAILYEMLTGERAFAADSQAGLIAALLDHQPLPITAVVPSAPRSIERVAQRCLEKDPDDRWHSAQDLAAELKWIEQSLRQPDAIAAPVVAPAAPRGRLFAAGGIVLAAAIALTVFLVNRVTRREVPATAAPVIHSRIHLPDGVSLGGWGDRVLALSPDGRILAIVGIKGGAAKLFVHRLDRDQTIEVPDSTYAETPFFSPDGQWIAFAVGVSGAGPKGELKKYSLATGVTQTIAEIPDFFGGAWRADGTIFFMGRTSAPLQKVRAEGGTPEAAVTSIRSTGPKVGNYGFRPQLLPDGRILLIVESEDGEPRPGILNVDTGEMVVFDMIAASASYLASGHLLCLRTNGALMAVPFDAKNTRVTGAEVPVLTDASIAGASGPAVAVAESGLLAYSTGQLKGSYWIGSRLVRVAGGEVTPLPFEPDYFKEIRASHDGNLLAVATLDAGSMWIYDLRRHTRTRLPDAGVRYRDAQAWTRDDSRIAFVSSMAGFQIYLQSVDGVSHPELVLRGPQEKNTGAFTPDGQSYVFSQYGGGPNTTGARLFRLRLGTNGPAERMTKSTSSEINPAFSPDGKWLAYAANDSGRHEVFVQPYPDLNRRLQVSTTGSSAPRWSADSTRIFYVSGTRLFAAAISGTGASVTVGEAREIVNIPGLRGRVEPLPDGSFIALQVPPDVGTVTELRLVVNWFDELRRLAPPK